MNDKAYPFRGDFRVDREVNHGHSGAWKVVPTSLSVRISGSNIRLEAIETSRNQQLACELGVGNLKPRSVSLPEGHDPLDVPGDGKEYRINAAVAGARSKHYCHLTLVGHPSATNNTLRVHVHPSCEPLFAEVDGIVIHPHSDGVLALPTHAASCQLRPALHRVTQSTVPLGVVQGYDNPSPVLILPSGEEIPVQINGAAPVELPVGAGVVHLKLPRLTSTPSAPAVSTPVDIDVRVTKENGQLYLVVTARGFSIELGVEGRTISGFHACTATLDPRRTSSLGLVVLDPNSKVVVLRQTLLFPAIESTSVPSGGSATQSYPISCRIEDGPGTSRVVFTPPDALVGVDGQPPLPGDRGVTVDCTYPKTVSISQRHPDGSTSLAHVTLPAAAPSGNQWLEDLANILEDPVRPVDQLLASLAALKPQTPAGQRVVQGIGKLLSRQPPNLEMKLVGCDVVGAPPVLGDLSCRGYNLAVAHGNNPLCMIPQGGSIQVDPRQPARLFALDHRGGVAASTTVHVPPQAPVAAPQQDGERLIKQMLDATNASATPQELAGRLLGIPTSNDDGKRLLPGLANMLNRNVPTNASNVANPPPPSSTAIDHDIMLQCNVERDSDISVAVQIDGNPAKALPASTPTPFSSSSKLVTLKVQRNSVSSPYEQELIDAYKRPEPKLLSRRWAEQCRPRDAREEELHNILLALARDLEKAAESGKSGDTRPPPPTTISVVCGDGQLTNIRCEGYQLSANVDDLPSIGVGQGSQIPQGVPFTDGTVHRVRLVARDSSGVIRGELHATLYGTKSQQAQVGVAYLDATIHQAPEQSLRVKLTCPPGFSINCDVDNKRAEASPTNEVTLSVDARRPHVVGVNVVDPTGCIVFQQKLEIPLMLAPTWALAIQNNNASLLPTANDRGFTVTAAIDQQPERILDGSQIRLDHDMPHQVLFRKYFGEASAPCGDMLLRFPHFVDPDDTLAAARAMQSIPVGGDPRPAMVELQKIHDRTRSGILRKLLGELLAKVGSMREDDYYKKTSSTTLTSGANSGAPSVFFRLRGDEERGGHR